MFKGHHQSDPIERPQSVVSVADTITTTTSIADFEDSLSNVTTPRGGSPTRFGYNNPDLPPSYDESQAEHLASHSESSFSHPPPPGIDAHSVQQVFRTEIPHRSLSDNVNIHTHHHPLHHVPFRGPGFGHPGSSALLYQALSFTTTAAATPTQSSEYVQHLTRPVAIPSLPHSPASSSPSQQKGVRFARFNARALSGASITPAQHASFIDGLNAVSTASGFSAAQLQTSMTTPLRLEGGPMGIAREEWVRAYVQLCNERFFQPRGLHAAITTLAELAVLAKIPEHRGFREAVVEDVLAVAVAAALEEAEESGGVVRDGEEESEVLSKAAANAAAKLDPYIEPLGMMIPTMSRDTQAMDNVARGLASFSLDEKPRGPQRAFTDQPGPRALDKFWNPLGLGPVSIGPIIPPRLPRTEINPQVSWGMWAEDFGKRFEKWGEEYGRRWDNWGRDYGKAWEEWSEEFQRKMSSGPSRSGVSLSGMRGMSGAAVSRESFATTSSKDSKKGKERQQSTTGQEGVENNEDDDDDASSISSVSTMSSDSDWEDPETSFIKRVAEIEETAERARIEGKKEASKIDKERDAALRKAEERRTKDEQNLEKRIKKQVIKRQAKKFKKDVKRWRKEFKRETKQLHKKNSPPQEMRARIAEKRAQFERMRAEWEARRREISNQQESGLSWRDVRDQKRQHRHERMQRLKQLEEKARQERKERRRRRWNRHSSREADCPVRGRREEQSQQEPEEQRQNHEFLNEENMLWVVIRNLE